MTTPPPHHSESVVKTRADAPAPRLSVLTPFHRDDPTPLLRALAHTHAAGDVEIILINDGGGDAALFSRVLTHAERLPFAATLIVWGANRGRAAARNRLIEAARGAHVLFLDADMIPERTDFLDRWLDIIAAQDPAVAFGGFTVTPQACAETKLHRALAARSDCRPAAQRAKSPAQFTATSNLLVRADTLRAVPFDTAFRGWGWEDVDWALRAAMRAPILHVDNPALHAGLDTVDTLLRKFGEAGPNYARLAAKHPDAVAAFRSSKAARVFQRAPARDRLKAAFEWIARDPFGVTPLTARCAALKLYRTAVYAEHLP